MRRGEVQGSGRGGAPEPFFFGWWIVAGTLLVLFVSSGIGFYGHGVILDPLRAHYGWSKGIISGAVSLYFLTAGILGTVVGRMVDRIGPRPVLIAGAVVIGLGFVLLSRIHHIWQLYVVYFVMAVGWSGTSLVAANTLLANWFIRRRGLAMSIAMTGLSLGGVVLVPLVNQVIQRWGLPVALPLCGAVFWAVIIPTAVFVLRRRPADMGLVPDGRPADVVGPEDDDDPLSVMSQSRFWNIRDVLRTTAFWAIVTGFLLALMGQISFLVHQVSFLSQYVGPDEAAAMVSITAAASIISRLVLGAFVDRLNKRLVAVACFCLQGFALLAFARSQHIVVLYMGTFIFGVTMGNILVSQSLIIGECFGMRSFGTVSGICGLFTMSGAAMGPALAGWLFDFTGGYGWAYTIYAAMSLTAAVAIVFARPPRRRAVIAGDETDEHPAVAPAQSLTGGKNAGAGTKTPLG